MIVFLCSMSHALDRSISRLLTTLGLVLSAASGSLAGQELISSLEAEQAVTQPVVGAYVYSELQAAIPFDQLDWPSINSKIREQPGLLNKTWLSGVGTQSVGGFYCFDTVENAQRFVTSYFPDEASARGVPQVTKIFDAAATESASRTMNSVYYFGPNLSEPKAYVYTEVQISALPFDKNVPWQEISGRLREQPGLLSKTWLSGLNTGTVGGLYAFDTIENAQHFATQVFPAEPRSFNAAFTTKVFDASATREASKALNSPYFR